MVGGALMQLVAYGSQDVYLTNTNNNFYNNVKKSKYTKPIKEYKLPSYNDKEWVTTYSKKYKAIKIIWDTECRLLDKNAKNTCCPISNQEIRNKFEYISCNECNYNFLKNPLQKALSYSNTCPLCRTEWKNYVISYNC